MIVIRKGQATLLVKQPGGNTKIDWISLIRIDFLLQNLSNVVTLVYYRETLDDEFYVIAELLMHQNESKMSI